MHISDEGESIHRLLIFASIQVYQFKSQQEHFDLALCVPGYKVPHVILTSSSHCLCLSSMAASWAEVDWTKNMCCLGEVKAGALDRCSQGENQEAVGWIVVAAEEAHRTAQHSKV